MDHAEAGGEGVDLLRGSRPQLPPGPPASAGGLWAPGTHPSNSCGQLSQGICQARYNESVGRRARSTRVAMNRSRPVPWCVGDRAGDFLGRTLSTAVPPPSATAGARAPARAQSEAVTAGVGDGEVTDGNLRSARRHRAAAPYHRVAPAVHDAARPRRRRRGAVVSAPRRQRRPVRRASRRELVGRVSG